MTTLQQIDFSAPSATTQFRSQTVVSTNSFGGKRTDFHERAAGTQPLPYLIHMCNRVRLLRRGARLHRRGGMSARAEGARVERARAGIHRDADLGSEKYEAAAKVAEWQGMEPRHVADLLLRAAWCCVDEGDIEAERFFRRKAAWKFEEALGSFDGVPRESARCSPISSASCGAASAT